MNPRLVLLFFFFSIWCLTGCAHFAEERLEESPGEIFLKNSLQKAAFHESKGEWVEALREYKIAFTLSPTNRKALEGRRRAEARLRLLAEEQYIMGLDLQKAGKFPEARRRFLTALRLRPDHAGALETLTSKKRLPVQEGYVVHKIQPGESLSKLAMMYYGDPAKFRLIARFNQIPDAHRVRVGQEIKVPTLAGRVTEIQGEKRPEVEEEKDIPIGYWDWSTIEAEQAERTMPAETAKAEEVDQIASYRELGAELFKEGRHQEALFEFKKVLSVYPDDQAASEYAYTASVELGLLMLQEKNYLAAREYFDLCLTYRADCPQCNAFLKESEELYKEMNYKLGIEHYGREQLAEAIKAWEMVEGLDRDYKRVGYYIRKAKEIQGKLEELKQETQQRLSE